MRAPSCFVVGIVVRIGSHLTIVNEADRLELSSVRATANELLTVESIV